ncbi:MAG TPA: hypothetical protein VIY86_07170, partial [Pirellulaceae bacterium]
DDDTKRRAIQFTNSIRADGSTDHLAALQAGLSFHPDVLYFLTDADRPQLVPDDLRRIDTWNHGSRILTIEFGRGPSPQEGGILEQLATQSLGEYRYVDVLKWKPPGH